MILTDFIVPIIVDTFPELEEIDLVDGVDINDLKKAPCLLSHLDKKPLNIPKDWTGCLFGSENVICQLQTAVNVGIISNARYLKIKESTSIKLSDDNTVEVTMFNLDHVNDASSMLLFQNMHIKCLYSKYLGNFEGEFVYNSLLKKTIQNGIDVLYIDDTIFGSKKCIDAKHPTEYQLCVLVYLVRPKEVVGIFGKEIPLYIKEFCQEIDYFSEQF